MGSVPAVASTVALRAMVDKQILPPSLFELQPSHKASTFAKAMADKMVDKSEDKMADRDLKSQRTGQTLGSECELWGGSVH